MTDTVTVSRELLRQVLRGLRMCDQQNQVLDDTYTTLRAALDATCQDSRQVPGCVDTGMQAATVLGLQPVAWVDGRWYEDGTRADNTLVWASRNAENDFPVGTQFYTSPQPTAQPRTAVPEVDDAPIPPDSRELKQQPRKAVKLTDGEVWSIWNCEIGSDEMNQQDAFMFASAIESAVWAKNGWTE